ncbi:MAG: efflux RND transporter periplasmic adaptor subunit [Opitutaceae bacterium]
MIKKVLVTVSGLVVVLGVLICIYALMIRHLIAAGASQGIPPVFVSTAPVRSESWERLLPSVGTVTAVQGVTVSAQVDGPVVAIKFQPGARVKAGELLVQQDVSVEDAELRSADAAVKLASLNLKRSAELLRKKTIAQSQFDTDQAAYTQAVAQADDIRAMIAKKGIRAPFAGSLGVRQVDLGQVLKAGDPIVSLQALEPVFVDFYLPQQDVGEVATGLKVETTSDAYPGKTATGPVTTIDPGIDAATRNLHLEATLANRDERLRPGMFVNVNVVLPGSEHVLAVPLTAILFAPYGDTVFVVENRRDPKTGAAIRVVRQQVVRLGTRRGDFVAVTFGLKAGETVVASGAFKLRPGMAVMVNNALAPAAELAPTPAES